MKDEYKLTCTIEERTSSKTGNTYNVLALHLTNTYVKDVFLDRAEFELLKNNFDDKELKFK